MKRTLMVTVALFAMSISANAAALLSAADNAAIKAANAAHLAAVQDTAAKLRDADPTNDDAAIAAMRASSKLRSDTVHGIIHDAQAAHHHTGSTASTTSVAKEAPSAKNNLTHEAPSNKGSGKGGKNGKGGHDHGGKGHGGGHGHGKH